MPTERQDGIELRNSVDNSAADAGFRDLERAADATSRRIAENQARASERAARAEEAARRASERDLKRGLSVGVGMATAAAGALGGALRSAGAEEAGSALEGAASGAARLGTMLAPLGPLAMAGGAAVGALGGAISALSESSAEAARRVRESAQEMRDASAAEETARAKPRTLEARADEQRQARERLDAIRHNAAAGATVTKEDVLFALDWDVGAALDLLPAYEKTGGGGDASLSDTIHDALLYAGDPNGYRLDMMEAAAHERYESQRELAFLPGILGGFEATGAQDRLAAVEALGERRLGLLARGSNATAWDSRLDRINARRDENERRARREADREFTDGVYGREREEPDADAGDGLRGAGAPAGRLLSASADSLGARGIGYGGSPMRETEKLLREIRDDARRAARRPGGAFVS